MAITAKQMIEELKKYDEDLPLSFEVEELDSNPAVPRLWWSGYDAPLFENRGTCLNVKLGNVNWNPAYAEQ